jgi:hypothetical protein
MRRISAGCGTAHDRNAGLSIERTILGSLGDEHATGSRLVPHPHFRYRAPFTRMLPPQPGH